MSTVNYQPPQLAQRLRALLDERFADAVPTVDDLASVDQFHTGGLAATKRLAAELELTANSRVLDIGSGLGGPARYLAATSGCTVHGIDASEPFVEAARTLSARAGLDGRTHFTVASALSLPFDAATFDVAIMQHVAMNIDDRAALYREIRRVLVPGGRFATYDVIVRSGQPDYPVPWALDATMSFLRTEEETERAMTDAGFVREAWRIEGPELAASLLPAPGGSPPMLAQLLGRPDFPQAIGNFSAALRDGRIAILTAVVRSGAATLE